MTARTLRRLRHLALRTLRRTALIPPAPAHGQPPARLRTALRRTVPDADTGAPDTGGPVNPGIVTGPLLRTTPVPGSTPGQGVGATAGNAGP
ncbi:hypothetical protein AB0J13_28975 [Streptomyces anulatus]|uniref:hypothetical protein n=1 Tax=Streptomyces anulatus TaxID=1892 RepID=UPI0033CD6EC4